MSLKTRLVFGLAFLMVCTISSRMLAATSVGSLSTSGFNSSSGHAYVGQSFIVPAGETGLVSATLMLHNESVNPVSGTMRIYPFSDDGSTGTFGSELASAPISVPNGAGQAISHTFNVPVITGSKYAVIADWGAINSNVGSYYSSSSYYSEGMTIFAGAGPVVHPSDLAFQVNFGVIPEPALAMLLPLTMLLRRRA